MGEYFKDEMKEMQKVMKITVGKMENKRFQHSTWQLSRDLNFPPYSSAGGRSCCTL